MVEMTPQEMKAYRSGAAARRKGVPRYSNPHHCATSAASYKYRAWFAGWDEQDIFTNPKSEDRQLANRPMPKYLMHVTVTTHYEFKVEAPNKDAAFEKGRDEWIDAPTVGEWEIPGSEDTSYELIEVREAAQGAE